ncbi:MAG: ATP-dependent helicase C-terminal domain-containing protein, partial [Microthrixaceae bacterium]
TAVIDAVRAQGPSVFANWGRLDALRSRVAFVRASEADGAPSPWPDLRDEALRDTALGDTALRDTALGDDSLHQDAPGWISVLLGGRDRFDGFDPTAAELTEALLEGVPYDLRVSLDESAPLRWSDPRSANGGSLPLSYGTVDGDPGSVLLSTRLANLLGVDAHPVVGPRRIPVVVELLSPAGRPLQRTTDLPGFWRGTYAQVRSEMRGRYPKHPWPERPWERPEPAP